MLNRFKIKKITQIIELGGTIAYPTESVFGLGCNPFDYYAVNKILQIKQRKIEKGLVLVASKVSQIKPLVDKIPQKIWQKIETSENTNWILPKSELVPFWISGAHNSIAIRISSHMMVKQICDFLDYPIVSTSANISTRPPLDFVINVRRNFTNKVDYIVDGKAYRNPPCKIVNPFTNHIVRE